MRQRHAPTNSIGTAAAAVHRLPAGLRRYLPRQLGRVQLRPTEAEERRLSVQDRLPIARCEGGIIYLKPGLGPLAVKILEVLPLNFRLKSPFERRQILRTFSEALNSLKHPIQLRNHAEPLDLSGYVTALRTLAADSLPPRRGAIAAYADFIDALTRDQELVRRRFFVSIPYRGYTHHPTPADVQKTLQQQGLDLAERLTRCGLTVVDLDDVALANAFHALLRPEQAISQRISADDLVADTLLNLIAPDCLDFTPRDHCRVGEHLSRVLMVTGYREEVQEGWLSDLYSHSPNVAITQHLEPAIADTLQRDISNSLGEIRHELSKGRLNPLETKLYELKEKSADYLLSQLASGSQQVLDFSMYVQITAATKAELDDLTRKMEALLGGQRMRSRRASYRTHQAFDTALPVALNRLKDATAWQMPAETVASTFPFDHAELSHTWGILRGINKFTQNAVIIDPYDPRLINPHEVSIATTGGGKSIEMKATLDRSHALGDRIFALDIEREYQILCLARGGQWINLAPGAGNLINPLELRPPALPPDHDADQDPAHQAGSPRVSYERASALLAGLQRQHALFGLMLPDLTEAELAWLEEVQFELYRQAGIDEHTDVTGVPRDAWPHLGHLATVLLEREQTQRLGVVLKRWTEGSLRGIVSGHTTVDLDASFVVIDLHDLEGMERAQPPILYAALTYLWDEIRRDRSERKTLAVDEMGLLKENQQALWFLWMVSKRARKYGCRLKTATQQVADFLAAGYYAEAIVGNAETKVLGRQKETDLAALKALIPFSEEEEALLAGMAAPDKLLMVGSQRVLITVECSPDELRIYDPKAAHRQASGGPVA